MAGIWKAGCLGKSDKIGSKVNVCYEEIMHNIYDHFKLTTTTVIQCFIIFKLYINVYCIMRIILYKVCENNIIHFSGKCPAVLHAD